MYLFLAPNEQGIPVFGRCPFSFVPPWLSKEVALLYCLLAVFYAWLRMLYLVIGLVWRLVLHAEPHVHSCMAF